MALIPGTNIPVPENVTAFSQVLPYEKIFNQELIDQMSYEQVAPDVLRERNQSLGDYARNMASTGGYQLGTSQTGAQNIRDQYQRQLAEQQASFSNQMKDWTTDWYNRQAQDYYTTPSRWKTPALPTWESVMGDLGISPSQKSSGLTSLEQGGWKPQGGYQSTELGQTRTPASRLVNPLSGVTNPNSPLAEINLAGAYK